MKKNALFIFIFVIPLLILGCNFEKLTGYKYDAQKPDNTVKISGRITNKFTEYGVLDAKIRFGVFETLTDANGEFVIYYQKGEDEDQNRIIPIEVSAYNYYGFADEIMIGELDFYYDIELEYGASMVERVYLTTIDSQTSLMNVVVQDYQGFNNISQVTGNFWITEVYTRPEIDEIIPVPFSAEITFQKGMQLTSNTGIYYASISNRWLKIGITNSTSTVYFSLTDYDNFKDDSRLYRLATLNTE